MKPGEPLRSPNINHHHEFNLPSPSIGTFRSSRTHDIMELLEEWDGGLPFETVGYSIDMSKLKTELKELHFHDQNGSKRLSNDELNRIWKDISDVLDIETNKAASYYTDTLTLIVAEMSSLRVRWPYLTPNTFAVCALIIKKLSHKKICSGYVR